MFDKKKIKLNHIKSFNITNKRVNSFFSNISDILMEKAFEGNKDYRNQKILEIAARNDILRKKICFRYLHLNYFQTCLSEKISISNNKRIVSNLNDLFFQLQTFDFCFSLLSLNSSDNILLTLKNIYNVLKVNGIFVSVFPSDDCLEEFRSYFVEYFKPIKNYNFNPLFDMQTLGNLCSAAGFRNVIVDKEKFQFNIKKPEEVWHFIRNVGEGNYLLQRKNFVIRKSLFEKFYNIYNKELEKGNLVKNTISVFFLIGKK